MTRSDLIAKLAERYTQLLGKDAELAVKVILDSMSATLSRGGRIEIRGFGSFALNYRPPRLGRNPKSGDKVQVPAKYVPHFKAGKELIGGVSRDVPPIFYLCGSPLKIQGSGQCSIATKTRFGAG